MAVVVNKSSSAKVTLTPTNLSSTAITIKKSTGGTVQSLSNVDSSDLEDGYTLIYDSDTNKWVAAPVTSGVVAFDGGSY